MQNSAATDEGPTPDYDPVALDGRTLGRRGLETRRKLLEATEELLATQSLRDVRVVDIARKVGTSPATFYQYFKDVEEAVLALSAEVVQDITPIASEIEGDWTGDGGLERARRIVAAFMRYWDAHRAILRVRNLAAEEGDERFRELRLQTLRPLTDAFDHEIAAAKAAGVVADAIDSYAAGAALVAMMERIGAYHKELGLRIPDDALLETTARIVAQTVAGSSES